MPILTISFTALQKVGLRCLSLICLLLLTVPAYAIKTVSGIHISKTTPLLNPAKQTFDSYITLTNGFKNKSINGPLALQINSITRKGVTVESPAGVINNKPYVYIPLPNGLLSPQQTLGNITVSFKNSTGKPFKFSAKVITQLPNINPTLPNHLPFAHAGEDQTITVGNTAQLNGSASTDPEGQALTYQWSVVQKPDASNAQLTEADKPLAGLLIDQPGQYRLQLVVNDGQTAGFPDTVLLDTQNSAPVAHAGLPMKSAHRSTVTLDASASHDPDAQTLTHAWSLPRKPGGSKAKINPLNVENPTLTVDKKGDYLARLIVSDGQQTSDPATVTISTKLSLPVAHAGGDIGPVPPQQPVQLSGVLSSDSDQDPLTYRWSLLYKPSGSAAQLSDADKQQCQFTPDSTGDYIAQLMVHDGHFNSDPDTVLIKVRDGDIQPVNHAPEITSSALTTASVGKLYTYDVEASDADTVDILSSTLVDSPEGMTINQQTGLINWTPSLNQIGTHNVTVNVADGKGGSDAQSFQITVVGSQAPKITSAALTTASVGKLYTYAAEASDADTGDILSYTLAGSPEGMSINPQTGLINWTPLFSQIGNHNVTLNVTDGKGGSDVQGFQITVVDSLSADQTRAPNLVGAVRNSVQVTLTQAALMLGSETFQHSDSVAEGQIISQSLSATSVANKGTAINLIISMGPNDNLPPNPVTVAPKLDQTVATTTQTASQFLYTGNNPIQTGVSAGTIEAKRAAVIRGKVLDKDNKPLPGVTVTIKDYPEFGQTLSRTDGQYDMAVNGGGVLTVNLVKDGFLPAQRTLSEVPWQDYVNFEDTIMLAKDSKVTALNLSSPEAIQIAEGSTVTDADGTRKAALMIPQGITALAYNPDGTTRTLPQLSLRFTEYTVGDNGPKQMPGPLPPNSAYTYAVEISADEAPVKLAGKDVLFNQPVPAYVDNFLNMPIGIQVPVAYYNREKAAWIASDDGRVIKILSIADGKANLDTNGDGAADSGAALGVTDAEREKLAQIYPAGHSLWRAMLTHLSTYDWNFGATPENGAEQPDGEPPTTDVKLPNPICTGGSIIECENQTLGEALTITGTPYSINYRSDRMLGRNSIDIPLSGPTIPAVLKRIDLEIDLAGRTFKKSFPAAANQSYTLDWDGKDYLGRQIQGTETAQVNIGYVYDGYYNLPPAVASSFGYASGVKVPGNVKAREGAFLWQQHNIDVKAWNNVNSSDKLKGWNLGVHHVYDPTGKTLYYGNGKQFYAEALASSFIIETALGDGTSGWGDEKSYNGEDKPANGTYINPTGAIASGPDGNWYFADDSGLRRVSKEGVVTTIYSEDADPSTFQSIQGIAVGSDGSVYFSENILINYEELSVSRVQRIAKNGAITTVAGGDAEGFSGDEGPATSAKLSFPSSLAIGSDGSLYISDTGNNRIRRVSPGGIITTIAGNGQEGHSGDGGPATSARLNPGPIALANDGTLFIADKTYIDPVEYSFPISVLRKLSPSGIISIVDKTNENAVCTLSQPFASSCFDITGLAVGTDNSLYISSTDFDDGPNRIRRISPDGNTTTLAGAKTYVQSRGDKGSAAAAGLISPKGIALVPDGSLLVVDINDYRIRRIRPVFPGLTDDNPLIASEDASEVYLFDKAGRHLQTYNALTNTSLYSFAYTAEGYLSQITDASGNITKIERNSLGDATAIIAPFGQRTELTGDTNGYLASVKNPAGETYSMSYTAEGLLTTFQDPLGNASTMTYDGRGLLLTDSNALNGKINLARSKLPLGYQVELTSPEGRKTGHTVETLLSGDQQRRLISPSLHTITTLTKTDGTVMTSEPDGSVTAQTQGPDPRFGMMSPIASSTEIKSAGLTTTLSNQRSVEFNNLSLKKLTDTQTINGRTSSQVYDVVSKTNTATSAAGRVSTTKLDNIGRPILEQITGILALNSSYDSAGHLESLSQGTGADLRKLDLSYNSQGYLAAVIDPLNRQVSFAYDQAGRVTKQTLPNGSVIDYTYDAAGNLTSLTPPGQPAHVFNYSKVNQVGEYDPPVVDTSANKTVYQYDLDKALTKITRPDGLTLDFTYDNAGRLSKQTVHEGDTNYAYDATTGKLKTITVPDGGKLTYNYNGKLLSQTALTGAVAGTVEYNYDNDFRINGIQVNGANSLAYSYDADSLLTQAGDLSLTPDPQNGLLTGSALGVITDTFSYNGFAETSHFEAKANSTSLLKIDYTRDQLGRITRKVETQGTTSNTFDYSYDNVGRLQEVKRNNIVTSTYSYDANGNRLSRVHGGTTTTGSYDAQDRLLTYGNASYTYTGNGELKTKTVGSQKTQYQYDVLSNLRQVSLPNMRLVDYLVDGQNRRIGKKINSVLVQGFLWQDQLRPIAELDGSGNITSRFVYANHANVPDYMIKGGVTYRLVTDHLGSPRLVVKAEDGSVVQRMDYDEFGQVTNDTNPGFQPFGFAGGLYDRDTGLVRFGVRDYDAFIGRWISKDPIGFEGGDSNIFAYVGNNSMNFVDYNGLIRLPPGFLPKLPRLPGVTNPRHIPNGEPVAPKPIPTPRPNPGSSPSKERFPGDRPPDDKSRGNFCPIPEQNDNQEDYEIA